MAELVYSAGLTSKLFWLQESRKTAGYILDGYSKVDIRKIAWEENIYQVKAEYRAYEILNGTYRRVSALPEAVLRAFTTCDVETAKILNLIAILMDSRLFFEFLHEVYDEKLRLGEKDITDRDDTQLMLNLQTIVEDLGTACKGKAWVIVTSQEDIDSITKTKGNDFSKIQGRFDTRLSLSASNVDEVIRKRVLAKNETATQTLRLLYEQKESIIKNLITFTADTADKKLYADKADFADCYPFIPYQFNLLGQVLTAVRTHGASGKHLSDQSRSMLALFQESAIRLMDKEDGVLVPFSYFYDPLHKFIDHQHSQVISDAENNSKLDEFDVELLKVLFMIKYVKEIKANPDNLTTLMISNIDDDRIEIRKKVEESLKKLIKETLVQKNGEIYIFLTNEEQEINNAINSESVEMGEIIGEVSTVIFEEIYTEKKYRYSSRYLFPFNQKVDDRFFKGNQSNDIGVTIITPYGGDYPDSSLRLLSASEKSVIVKLPNDSTFLEEIRESIKIYKYLNKNASGARGSFESIRRAKEDERIEKKDRIKIYIEEAIKNADIYVNGDKATISAKEPASRINEALGKLVAMQYNKLTYMETAPEISDIDAIFKKSDGQMSFLGTSDTTPNKLALEEVVQIIGLNNARHVKTSLKSLQDKFGAAPYGFDPKDVQWLVAMLFKLGRVSLTLNSQSLSLLSTNQDELVRYITKREYVEKLLIDIRERATDGQIRSAKEVMKDYFGFTVSSDDDDKIMSSFKNRAKDKVEVYDDILVEYRINSKYPCKRLMEEARKRLAEILDINEPTEFFKTVDKKRDDLLDDAEDTAPVFDFFKGDQKKIFEEAVKNLAYFGNSKTYVSDQELLKVVEEIETIVKDSKPFGKIQRLPELNKRFEELHMGLLEKEAAIMDPLVHDDFLKVKEVLDTKSFAEVLRPRINQRFDEIWEKLRTSSDIAAIKNIKLESDTLKIKCLDEIDEYERAHQPAPEPPVAPVVPGKEPINPTLAPTKEKTKRRKNVSISNVAGARTYSIETEQDIDKFLAEMKQKLMNELEEDTIITLS